MVKIISDSTSDLTKELIEKYDLTVVPLHIILGEKEYKDGVNITRDEIFAWSDANNQTPKTAAPGFDDTIDMYKNLLSDEDEAIAFTISESMSTSFNVLNMAAEELGIADRVTVINSQNLSTGISLLIIKAAIMAKEGKSRAEIVEYINTLIPKVRSSFVVDTLTYLHRGGRCSGLAALAGGVLKLHPKIVVKNGAMGAEKKYRGKIEKVIENYVDDLIPALANADPARIFITHSVYNRDVVEGVRAKLAALNYFEEIIEAPTNGVICCHCGPGTLGVLYIEK